MGRGGESAHPIAPDTAGPLCCVRFRCTFLAEHEPSQRPILKEVAGCMGAERADPRLGLMDQKRFLKPNRTLGRVGPRFLPATSPTGRFHCDEVLVGTAELEAAYRFFGNAAVSPDGILAGHFDGVRARAEQEDTVRALHDTSVMSFRHDGERRGDDGKLLPKRASCSHCHR